MILYNEIDPGAADWLRELIHLQAIPPGVVDTRSIKDLTPDDVRPYTQAHFFAGIGGWAHAATLAGWPVTKPLWTGSCPCQPFSVAGKGAGFADDRDLWPDFFRLIRACRPPVVVGEPVAGKAGYGWLDRVRADLAGEDYASRGVDIPACAVDAPHIRSRLYWVAIRGMEDAATQGTGRRELQRSAESGRSHSERPSSKHPRSDGCERVADARYELRGSGPVVRDDGIERADLYGARAMADTDRRGYPRGSQDALGEPIGRTAIERVDDVEHAARLGRGEGRPEPEFRSGRPTVASADARGVALGDANGAGLEGRDLVPELRRAQFQHGGRSAYAGHEWLVCHDGKARRTKPGIPLLVDGVSGGVDVGRALGWPEAEGVRMISRTAAWRGFGNAIVPQLAAEVLAALL